MFEAIHGHSHVIQGSTALINAYITLNLALIRILSKTALGRLQALFFIVLSDLEKA